MKSKRDKVKSMIETASDVTIANILDVLERVSSVVNLEALCMDITHDIGDKIGGEHLNTVIAYLNKWFQDHEINN